MTWVALPALVVGPAATLYWLPRESVTETTLEVESFQPIATRLRSPAFWAAAYCTARLPADVGSADVPCTYARGVLPELEPLLEPELLVLDPELLLELELLVLDPELLPELELLELELLVLEPEL